MAPKALRTFQLWKGERAQIQKKKNQIIHELTGPEDFIAIYETDGFNTDL